MSIDFTAGTLYIQKESGGEIIPIPATPELRSIEDETAEKTPSIIRLMELVELKCELKINQRTMLSILLGRNITNNWLKMHGGIMSRKGVKNHGV